MTGSRIPRGTSGTVADVNGKDVECRFDGYQGTWFTSVATLEPHDTKPPTPQPPPPRDHDIADLISKLGTGKAYMVKRSDLEAIGSLPAAAKSAFIASVLEQLHQPRFASPAEWDSQTKIVAEFYAIGLAVAGPCCIDPVIQYGQQEFDREDCRGLAARTLSEVAHRYHPSTFSPDDATKAIAFMTKVVLSGEPIDGFVWKTVEGLAAYGKLASSAKDAILHASQKIDRTKHKLFLDVYQKTLLEIGG